MTTHWRDDLDVWVSPVLANLIWVMLSIPIITMPLAFVGLLAVMFHWMRDRRTQVFSIYFNTIKQTWRKAYALALVDVLVGGFLLLNISIFLQMDMSQWLPRISLGATVFALAIFLVANVVAWVLVAVWDAPLKLIIRRAIELVFINPFWTVIMALCFYVPFAFSLVLPVAVFMTVMGALAGAIASHGTRYLMTQYLSSSQMNLLKVI